LVVAKIQYASPGEISLRGDKKALSNINDLLDVFDEKWRALSATYRNIRRALQKENLLSARPSASFSSPATEDFIRRQTAQFARDMRLERAEEIERACGRNALVFAKVVLSIFRRANELYRFHAEGRVQRV
jgi:hypothetical protein